MPVTDEALLMTDNYILFNAFLPYLLINYIYLTLGHNKTYLLDIIVNNKAISSMPLFGKNAPPANRTSYYSVSEPKPLVPRIKTESV